jgi:hypothetical protein
VIRMMKLKLVINEEEVVDEEDEEFDEEFGD